MTRTPAVGHAPRTRDLSARLCQVGGCIGCLGCTGLCAALIEALTVPDTIVRRDP